MLLTIVAAQAAEPVLAAFEPMAAFMILGSGLLIAGLVLAILSPDTPDDAGTSDDTEVHPTGH